MKCNKLSNSSIRGTEAASKTVSRIQTEVAKMKEMSMKMVTWPPEEYSQQMLRITIVETRSTM